MTEVLDKVIARQADRQRARESDWRELVRQIAGGKAPSAERVEAVLAEAGKTVQDLRAAVEFHQRRVTLRHRLDAEPTLLAERAELVKRIEAEDAKLTAAEQHHQEATAPLHARIREIAQATQDAGGARDELFRGCPYPALREQYDQASRALAEATARRVQLREQASAQRAMAQGADDREGDGREQVYRERAEGLDRQAQENEKLIADLERQERDLLEQMLAP